MQYQDVNHLIELIYEAATNPQRWYDLLNSLAEFVDHIDDRTLLGNGHVDDTGLPALADADDRVARASISETLKSISTSHINKTALAVAEQRIDDINELLIGHFARAIKIAKRLVDMDEQHEVVLSLLDRLPIALVLVNSQARVIETNALADEVLSNDSGLYIRSGYLCAGQKNHNKVSLAIEAMSKHDPATSRGKTLSLTQENGNNLMLFLAPIKHHGMNHEASVAIFVSQRKSQPLTLPPELSELYGLTEKEIDITGKLVRGLSIKEIAEQKNISQHTVRSQLKAIFRKTETSRQAELVSLVYNGMGSFINTVPEVNSVQRKGLLSKSRPWQFNHKTFQLADGRNMAYQQYGDPQGELLVHCHSVLGSRLEHAFNADELLKQHGLKMLVFDRPGYGLSDPDNEASFMRWAGDLEQYLDAVDVQQCYLSGYAMGGQYALACAHQIPQRIKKVVLISAGVTAKTKHDFEKMVPLYKMNIRLARHIPRVYKLLSAVLVKGIMNDPDGFYQQLAEKLDAADRQVIHSEEFRHHMFDSMKEGFKQGGKASSQEIIQYMHGWGFALDKIETPVDIWHGDCDHHVPVILTEKFESLLPNKQYFIQSGAGHYLFYTHWDKILAQLLS